MPLVFLEFPYPALKNLVDQMTKTDLLRVSLQNEKARNTLKEFGKEVSYFDLDLNETRRLNYWDRCELFLSEVARSGMHPEFPLGLAAAISDKHQIRIIGECYYPYMHIDSITKIDSYDGIRRNMKIGEDIVPFVFYHENGYIDELTAFFDDKTEGFLSILKYFKNHLNISVSSLDIHGNNGPEFSKTMRDVIHSCSQMAVSKTIEESEQPLSEQDLNFILKSFETFHLETEEKLEFHLEIDSDSITIRNGSWFQLDHLLVGCQKYEEIHVTESKLTENDMKTFLTQWKDGKFPKLKNLSVKTVMTDSFDAVRDFEQYPTDSTARSRIPCVSIKGYENMYAMITQRAGPKMFNMEVRRQNGRARGFRATGYRLGNNRGGL